MAENIFREILNELKDIFKEIGALGTSGGSDGTKQSSSDKPSNIFKSSGKVFDSFKKALNTNKLTDLGKVFKDLVKTSSELFKGLQTGGIFKKLSKSLFGEALFGEASEGALAGAGRAAAVGTTEEAGGALAEGAGIRAVAAAGTIGLVVGAVVVGFAALTNALSSTVKRFLESQRELAKWSGTLTASFQQSGIKDMQRDISTAKQTADSTAALNKEYTKLKDTLQPFSVLWTKFISSLLAGVTSLVNFILTPLSLLVKGFNWVTDAVAGFGGTLATAFEWVANLGSKSWDDISTKIQAEGRRDAEQKRLDDARVAAKNLPNTDFFQRAFNMQAGGRRGKFADIRDNKRPLFN